MEATVQKQERLQGWVMFSDGSKGVELWWDPITIEEDPTIAGYYVCPVGVQAMLLGPIDTVWVLDSAFIRTEVLYYYWHIPSSGASGGEGGGSPIAYVLDTVLITLAPLFSVIAIDLSGNNMENLSGHVGWSPWFWVPYTSSAISEQTPRPEVYPFALNQKSANPFSGITKLEYSLPSAGFTHLNIYNSVGQVVKTLIAETRPAGKYEVLWDGRSDQGQRLPSGVYFARLATNTGLLHQKLVLLR